MNFENTAASSAEQKEKRIREECKDACKNIIDNLPDGRKDLSQLKEKYQQILVDLRANKSLSFQAGTVAERNLERMIKNKKFYDENGWKAFVDELGYQLEGIIEAIGIKIDFSGLDKTADDVVSNLTNGQTRIAEKSNIKDSLTLYLELLDTKESVMPGATTDESLNSLLDTIKKAGVLNEEQKSLVKTCIRKIIDSLN